MTTEELIKFINNSDIKSLSRFLNKLPQMCPDVSNATIIHKTDLGMSGTLGAAVFNFGQDEIMVKGFLYEPSNWSEETHGYIIAKKI